MSEEGRGRKASIPIGYVTHEASFLSFSRARNSKSCRCVGWPVCLSVRPSLHLSICVRRACCLGSFGYVLVSAYDNKWMWISMAIPFFDLCSFESLIILFFKMVDSDCSYNLTCLSMRSHMNITPGHIYHYAYVWSQWHIQNWFITTPPIYSWASRECMSGDSIEIENFIP